jgi:hypothetical protein
MGLSGVGGYSYLYEPLWWAGMITMLVGEVANFTAYAFAPAVLVTPLGALSIIVSAALAHVVLKERLHTLGVVGCVLCIVGSTTIVLHAPQEQTIDSVEKVWGLATEPAFLLYTTAVVAVVLLLIFHYVPQCGHTHVLIYIAICSLMGSLSVPILFVPTITPFRLHTVIFFHGGNSHYFVCHCFLLPSHH